MKRINYASNDYRTRNQLNTVAAVTDSSSKATATEIQHQLQPLSLQTRTNNKMEDAAVTSASTTTVGSTSSSTTSDNSNDYQTIQ